MFALMALTKAASPASPPSLRPISVAARGPVQGAEVATTMSTAGSRQPARAVEDVDQRAPRLVTHPLGNVLEPKLRREVGQALLRRGVGGGLGHAGSPGSARAGGRRGLRQ